LNLRLLRPEFSVRVFAADPKSAQKPIKTVQ
jgi:hypothetical protein